MSAGRWLAIAAGAAVAVSCAAGPSSPPTSHSGVAASCAGPTLHVSPATVRPGDAAVAVGEWFAADCYDTGQPGSPPPLTAMRVEIEQHGHVWTLATGVDASGPRYSFRLALRLPGSLEAGRATVSVKGYGQPAVVVVRR